MMKNPNMIEMVKTLIAYVYLYLGVDYFSETKGESSCEPGFKIFSSEGCELACRLREKFGGSNESFMEWKPCYIAGNGKCKQDGHHGSKASLVCCREDHNGMRPRYRYIEILENLCIYDLHTDN